MAKLYFRYGAMGSSKTANALMVEFNYRERGMNVLLLKPIVDTREVGVISTRIGLSSPCSYVEDFINAHGEIVNTSFSQYDAIIVDEAQFMTAKQVDALAMIVDGFGIPVLCYGLRTDFRGEFFPGSGRLMAVADKVEEVKTICWCGAKASFNARYDGDGIIKEGEQVHIGGNERYISLCRKHFIEGKLGEADGKTLSARDVNLEDDVEVSPRSDGRMVANFYMCLWDGIELIEGFKLEYLDDDAFQVNAYANYDIKKKTVCDHIDVIVTHDSDAGLSVSLIYPLSGAEKAIIRTKMESHCRSRYRMSLDEVAAETTDD